MSQNDMVIANQIFPDFRADVTAALQALASNSSGPSQPAVRYPFMLWADDATNTLMMRNEANNAWLTLADINPTTNRWELRADIYRALTTAGLSFRNVAGTQRVLIADNGKLTLIPNAIDGAAVIDFSATLSGTVPASGGNAAHVLYADGRWGGIPQRNLIINGSGRINQRAYVSNAVTSGTNQFALDRWFVLTSGQRLIYSGTDAARMMTAPAGGVAQVIEGANIVGGTYCINWEGTAACTVNGTARAKGATFTLTAGANATVRFTNGTFTNAQLELSVLPTAFEMLDIGAELLRCQRYFCTGSARCDAFVTNTGLYSAQYVYPVEMRAAPTVLRTSTFNAGFPATPGTLANESARGAFSTRTATATASGVFTEDYTASAELTA